MGKEIERKYLILEDGIDSSTPQLTQIYPSIDKLRADVHLRGNKIRQGYLDVKEGSRLAQIIDLEQDFEPTEARLRDKEGKLTFTLKGKGGLVRNESEQQIPRAIFDEYWPRTEGKRVEKVRLAIPYENFQLEIDVYTDRNLIVAEIEVPSIEDAAKITTVGKDVTDDPKYKNNNLAK